MGSEDGLNKLVLRIAVDLWSSYSSSNNMTTYQTIHNPLPSVLRKMLLLE